MPATPIVPTQNIKSLTLGSARTPGNITIVNGEIVIVDGSAVASYNIKFDGPNAKILIGSSDQIVLDGANKKITIGSYLTLDGANERIIQSDGTNDRILLGKATGLF